MMMSLAVIAVLAANPLESDQLPDDYQLKVLHRSGGASDGAGGGVLGRASSNGVLGIDTIPSFSSSFYFPGAVPSAFGDFPQYTWQYTMVGKAPFGRDSSERTTTIDAPIIPVIIDLRNADGSPRYFTRADGTQVRMILDASQYVMPVLNSPIFQDVRWGDSERPTQYTDAVHRAQFYDVADDDWHTRLRPSVKKARTMVLIRGTYRFSINPTTGKLNYVLVDEGAFNSLFWPPTPDDTASIIGGAEHDGDITTKSIASFLFPDTYLMDSSGGCCVLGYHSYDVEPGSAANGWREKHYVLNYSSWVTPGLFGPSFADITPLSHELSETFSDPFVNNATPVWVSPNGLCQNNLEDGDVIEGLDNATYPVTVKGTTYHPQNEALLQWFAGVDRSRAYKHAYSFPDPTVLTAPAVSYFSDCATPFNFAKAKK